MTHDRIAILDFGSQYTQLIARRVREIGVYAEIFPYDVDATLLAGFGAKAYILSGSPESTTDSHTPRAPEAVVNSGLPVLGICYGMQTLAAQLGGATVPGAHREFGYAEVEPIGHSRLLDGLNDRTHASAPSLDVWMSHGDRVEQVPPGFRATARTISVPIVAMEHSSRPLFGIQFHPEVTHTKQGAELLKRFCIEIAGCRADWNTNTIIDEQIARTRALVGADGVLLGLSGGVDSSVVAALLHRAIGAQLTCVFVDTGLLRLNEGDEVMRTFAEHLGVKVIRVDARDTFYSALAGVDDPEAKRKIIGRLFVEVFETESLKLADVRWLAQGTIYPDVIESAGAKTGKAHVIKSHHNVGGLPAHMRLKLLEPLRELFKDEVRKLGLALDLSPQLIHRHPFPGPGLGVRILGEIKPEYVARLQHADHIFIEELRRAGWYERTAQAFAVLLPCKSVGVVGDARAYEPVIALRAVETIDFMTARWAELPYPLLDVCARRIVNEVRGVSRVVYDISGKPPATIEWE
jgi:GMP synthase (glutamine-hydrolysing)